MPRLGFESTTPVFELARTVHALDRAVILIDRQSTLTGLIREAKLLTPWSRFLLQKLIVSQLVRKFSAIIELEAHYFAYQTEMSDSCVILRDSCSSRRTFVFEIVSLAASNCYSVYLQVLYHRNLRTRHTALIPSRNTEEWLYDRLFVEFASCI
jgi:hypothetical protein